MFVSNVEFSQDKKEHLSRSTANYAVLKAWYEFEKIEQKDTASRKFGNRIGEVLEQLGYSYNDLGGGYTGYDFYEPPYESNLEHLKMFYGAFEKKAPYGISSHGIDYLHDYEIEYRDLNPEDSFGLLLDTSIHGGFKLNGTGDELDELLLVNIQLGRLEKQWNGYKLTEYGKSFLDYSQKIAEQYTLLYELEETKKEHPKGINYYEFVASTNTDPEIIEEIMESLAIAGLAKETHGICTTTKRGKKYLEYWSRK